MRGGRCDTSDTRLCECRRKRSDRHPNNDGEWSCANETTSRPRQQYWQGASWTRHGGGGSSSELARVCVGRVCVLCCVLLVLVARSSVRRMEGSIEQASSEQQRRETHSLNVNLLTSRLLTKCCAAGLTPSHTTISHKSVHCNQAELDCGNQIGNCLLVPSPLHPLLAYPRLRTHGIVKRNASQVLCV